MMQLGNLPGFVSSSALAFPDENSAEEYVGVINTDAWAECARQDVADGQTAQGAPDVQVDIGGRTYDGLGEAGAEGYPELSLSNDDGVFDNIQYYTYRIGPVVGMVTLEAGYLDEGSTRRSEHTMKITAAVLRAGHGQFSIEDLELESPRRGEVLVRMVATGMCHTDLLSRELPPEYFAGPQVYGHEGSGVVEEVGDGVADLEVGDHVVLSFNSCGSCPACDRGKLPYCFNFSQYNMSGGRPDGSRAFVDAEGQPVGSHFFGQSSFASHSVVARTSVVRIDSSYDLSVMGPLGCGIQTGAGAILNTLDVQPGASVVVTGAGALGLSAVMAAKVAGAETIIAIDRHANRLELAERYGATSTLSGAPGELRAGILDATSGGADAAFDTTGNAGVVRAAFEGLNNLGTLALAGVGFGDLTFDFLTLIGGRTITGVIEGDSTPNEFIPRLAALNAEGRFPYDELITKYRLDQINEAEAASASGAVIKPVLTFD